MLPNPVRYRDKERLGAQLVVREIHRISFDRRTEI